MKERIEAIIQHERLTPSQFADTIGVQRSGVSHILSGRNKPSVDFLNKLLSRFPHFSGDWLITGHGQMLAGTASTNLNNEQLSLDIKQADKPKTSFKMPKKELKEEVPVQYESKQEQKPLLNVPPLIPGGDKPIERIIVFYKDKSFSDYRPE
ncbi:MAG: helix-turn-helix domain-containing protein [Carboxylicivirga sp.]|jgi:transcriptional regulator with XRE-family HTH domain|nr:helix-turn-helix domain-containing protein [Carboxylicivirga sp.]